MPEPYDRTIATAGIHEIEIRKSRFICTLAPASNETDARSLVDKVRQEHWSANHHCTAWRIGTGGRLQRSNDDGEPSGTAGTPMLEVLAHRDLIDVVAVVTRYFGGTRLGVGGLIRAYGGALTAAIDAIGIVERRPLQEALVEVPHMEGGRVEHALRTSDFPPREVTYNASGVVFGMVIEPERIPHLRAMIADLTSGSAAVELTGVQFVNVPVPS